MEVLHQVEGNGFNMLRGFFKPSANSILVQAHDPGCCSDAVALSQASQCPVERLLACLQVEERGATARRECPFAHFAVQQLGVVLPIGAPADDLVVRAYLAVVVALFVRAEKQARIDPIFHSGPPQKGLDLCPL